jgi:hypothetical protein
VYTYTYVRTLSFSPLTQGQTGPNPPNPAQPHTFSKLKPSSCSCCSRLVGSIQFLNPYLFHPFDHFHRDCKAPRLGIRLTHQSGRRLACVKFKLGTQLGRAPDGRAWQHLLRTHVLPSSETRDSTSNPTGTPGQARCTAYMPLPHPRIRIEHLTTPSIHPFIHPLILATAAAKFHIVKEKNFFFTFPFF